MSNRLDEFDGSDSEYITYLEKELSSLRTHHQYCLSSNATTTLESRDCLNVARCTTNSPPAKKQRTAIQPWRRMASALVETTPKAQQWWDAVHERGIYKALSTGDAAAYILDCDCSPAALEPSAYHLARQTAEGQSSVLSQLATFAYTATRREASASAAIILANFQKFLVISSCAVLYQSGSPREEVFNIVRICIGKAQDRYCQQTIRSVIWMNRLIDMLSSHGWGNRATDLLLIWNKQPTAYHAVASSPEMSLQFFETELTRPEFVEGVNRGKWIPFFVPSLVHQILEKSVTVSRIGHILGYKFDERINPWHFSGDVSRDEG